VSLLMTFCDSLSTPDIVTNYCDDAIARQNCQLACLYNHVPELTEYRMVLKTKPLASVLEKGAKYFFKAWCGGGI